MTSAKAGRSTLVLRLLGEEDKGGALLDALRRVRRGETSGQEFVIDTEDFRTIPNTPLCYWVSDRMRALFTELQPLEGEGRLAKQGLITSEDERFVFQYWEVDARSLQQNRPWFPYAKGGSYVPFYRDVDAVVRWRDRGSEISSFVNAKYDYLKGNAHKLLHVDEELYLGPALTWVRRTKGLCLRAFPRGGIFSNAAQGVVVPEPLLLPALAILNSSITDYLIKLSVGRTGDSVQFEPGMLSNLPWPEPPDKAATELGSLAKHGWELQRQLDTATQTSHAFVLPALLQVDGSTLAERAERWVARVAQAEIELRKVHEEIDELAFGLYGLESEDWIALSEGAAGAATALEGDEGGEAEEPELDETHADEAALASALVSWLVGAAFGRFDIRLATGEVRAPEAPGPFDPLPVCAPGILVGPEGLPATSSSIASASFLKARKDAATYPDPKQYPEAQTTSAGYPVRVAWDGILVEDPGLEGESASDADLVRRIREVMKVIWGESARDVEEDLARLLGVSDLRDYITRHTQFFDEDLRRYNRTRKAPIYWSLSTESGGYTLWIYYPRLSHDTLYRAVSEHVEPKITSVDRRITRLSNELDQTGGREAARLSAERSELESLRSELADLREELLRVAELPYRPNLDDGVEINAAPLWRLFPHRPWQKRLKNTWKKLEGGEYDWAHMALALWPGRVREACRDDQSIAIAHELEELYEEGA